MEPRNRWLAVAAVFGGVFLALAVAVPVPFVTLAPGPVFDILGEVDDEPVLSVQGARTYPTTGRLDMTTVSETGGTSGSVLLGEAMWAWLNPDLTVQPVSARYGDADLSQLDQQNKAVFDASSSVALAAAADYLGRPVDSRVVVSAVEAGAPAAGILEPGDEVRTVEGAAVATAAEVVQIMGETAPGDEIGLGIVHDGAPEEVAVVAGERPDGGSGGYLGVLLSDLFGSDFTVEVALTGIGGPSAGLVFALGIVDEMTPRALMDGRHVAGTGAIEADGTVTAIGGIDKKLTGAAEAGAELFLAPRSNCADVAGRVPDGLTVAAVGTLEEAVDAVGAWTARAADLPGCG